MKPYLPTNLPDAIAHVEEECGEFIAAVGKYRRFGLDSSNPEKPENKETNLEWMLREFEDIVRAGNRMLVFAQRKRDYDEVFGKRASIERGLSTIGRAGALSEPERIAQLGIVPFDPETLPSFSSLGSGDEPGAGLVRPDDEQFKHGGRGTDRLDK